MTDLDAEIEPTGRAVTLWVKDHVPPSITLVEHTVEDQSGIAAHRFSIQPGAEDDVIEAVAIGSMARRLMQRPSAFGAWHSSLTTDRPLAGHETVVRRFVASALGGPTPLARGL